MTTNSLGFRDRANREIPLVSDKYRVLFIGDSFCEGIGIPYEDTFVGLLEDITSGTNLEVLNAGVASYSPKLYYLRVRRLIELGLRFNELIVLIDLSDLQDEILYERYSTGTAISTAERIILAMEKNLLSFRIAWPYLSLYFWSKVGTPDRAYLSADALEHWDTREEFLAARVNWSSDESCFELWGRRGLELAENQMNNLMGICRTHHINVTIVVYPWPQEIEIIGAGRISRYREVWKEYAKKQGLNFLDLYPEFINGGKPEMLIKRYYIANDCHWNEQGHDLVAKAFFRYLKFRGLLFTGSDEPIPGIKFGSSRKCVPHI